MKQLLLFIIFSLLSFCVQGAPGCIQIALTSQTATQATFSFTLTGSGGVTDYTITIASGGVTVLDARYSSATERTLPYVVGTATINTTASSVNFNAITTEVLDATSGYDVGLCNSNVVLPLDLLSFQAQTTGKNNLLKWQTANEVNTQSFDIERSANGKNFEKVGNVKSAGTAKGAYQFTDEVPLNGVNYYRLKMMDIDGSFTYSPIRSVVLGEGKATNVSIAPNPAKGQVFVKLNADDAKAITLVLVDVTGKTVLTERKNLESGFNQLPLNVSNYPQGLYFLKIVDANTTETHRLVIGN
jgi:hypothetical protein